jgi:hypothetical protein
MGENPPSELTMLAQRSLYILVTSLVCSCMNKLFNSSESLTESIVKFHPPKRNVYGNLYLH